MKKAKHFSGIEKEYITNEKIKSMARAISDDFLESLKSSDLLSLVREDDTLNMELRGTYVTVYYRGCAVISMSEDLKMTECNDKYFIKSKVVKIPSTPFNIVDYLERSKSAINKFIFLLKENSETEAQQLIVRENNYSAISNDTDYFIVDIEYKDRRNKEFDLIALHWDKRYRSNPKKENLRLTIFELKYGINAIGDSSAVSKKASISAHMDDFNKLNADISEKSDFCRDMCKVFKQKCQLGLIRFGESKKDYQQGRIGNDWATKIDSFSDEIVFGYIFANYNKRSKLIKEELNKFKDDFVFVTSSFMGYGLYSSEVKYRSELEKNLEFDK